MTNIRTQIANALMHELDEHGYEDDDEKRGQIAHHFTDVLLALPGITIVQLPATTDKTYKRWINFPPNNQQVSYRGVGVTPTDIRQFAAALLTAANEAEKT